LLPSEIIIVWNKGQAYDGLRNNLGGSQGRGQEMGRAQQDGDLLGDGCESYSDSKSSAPSN
jgi:hypothetical protein